MVKNNRCEHTGFSSIPNVSVPFKFVVDSCCVGRKNKWDERRWDGWDALTRYGTVQHKPMIGYDLQPLKSSRGQENLHQLREKDNSSLLASTPVLLCKL
jgi:hypothetical protein